MPVKGPLIAVAVRVVNTPVVGTIAPIVVSLIEPSQIRTSFNSDNPVLRRSWPCVSNPPKCKPVEVPVKLPVTLPSNVSALRVEYIAPTFASHLSVVSFHCIIASSLVPLSTLMAPFVVGIPV